MKKMLFSMFAAAAASLLSSGAVQADPSWSYSPVVPDFQIYNNNNESKTSAVKFSGKDGAASGNSGIIIYNATTEFGPIESAPDTFSNVPFTLSIRLTDIKTNGQNPITSTGVVTFNGLFNATNVTKSSLVPGVNTWEMVEGNISATKASITLGAGEEWRTYTVDITSFTSPGQPLGAPGSIQAVVTIAPGQAPEGPPTGGGDPEPNPTPEPASLLLAGLGLPLVVLVRRRMKKAQAESIVG